MVYGTYNYSIHGVYQPSYNWAPHWYAHDVRILSLQGSGSPRDHQDEAGATWEARFVREEVSVWLRFFSILTLDWSRVEPHIPWRIHGAAIYGNMDPINISPMLAYIPYMDPMGYGWKNCNAFFFPQALVHWSRWQSETWRKRKCFVFSVFFQGSWKQELKHNAGDPAHEKHWRSEAFVLTWVIKCPHWTSSH